MDKPIPDWLKQRINVTQQDTVKIKAVPLECEDCGKTVINRIVRMSISDSLSTHPHIKSQCKTCGFYLNPQTGCYDATFNDVNNQFKKRKNQSLDK